MRGVIPPLSHMSSWRGAYKLSTRDNFSLPLHFETGMKAENCLTATISILATSDCGEFGRAESRAFIYIAGNRGYVALYRAVMRRSFSVCPSVSQLGSLCRVCAGS
jgi:hypothetical protein